MSGIISAIEAATKAEQDSKAIKAIKCNEEDTMSQSRAAKTDALVVATEEEMQNPEQYVNYEAIIDYLLEELSEYHINGLDIDNF